MAKPKPTTGRVTPSKRTIERHADDREPLPPAGPAASSRYTPKTPTYRVRPGWHRWAGWLGVATGVGIAAANDVMLMTEGLTLLPGGHSELYLLLGMGTIGGATWFLGLFDRGTTVYD